MAMSEEPQVAVEVQGVRLPGGNSLMGESQLGKALRPQILEWLLFLLGLCVFALLCFSGIWHGGAWVWRDFPTVM